MMLNIRSALRAFAQNCLRNVVVKTKTGLPNSITVKKNSHLPLLVNLDFNEAVVVEKIHIRI